MSDELPEEIKSWIGQERYQEKGEFPVERGYIWTTCASVENGNPLYWDDSTAEEITDGKSASSSEYTALPRFLYASHSS